MPRSLSYQRTGTGLVLRACYIIPIFIFCAGSYFLGIRLGIQNADLTYSMLPWFQEVKTKGLDAISGEFSDYTPPYIYLLFLASIVSGSVSDVIVIKLINICFIFIGGILIYSIIRALGLSVSLSVNAGLIFVGLPTVVINGVWWGQCDIIYASFLLAFFLFSLRGASLATVTAFGAGLSFKLQAIFLGPYLLFLLINGNLRFRHALLIPVVYILLMVPQHSRVAQGSS